MSGKTINGVDIERYNAKSERMKAKAALVAAFAFKKYVDERLEKGPEEKTKKKTRKPMDANRKKVLQIIAKLRSEGETFDFIALHLIRENIQTFSGRGQWHAQTVQRFYQDKILL